MHRSLTVPLILTGVATLAFGFAPVVLGYSSLLHAGFVFYITLLGSLTLLDSRSLGIGLILSAALPANAFIQISYCILLAVVCVTVRISLVTDALVRLASRWWYVCLVFAFLTALMTVPFWGPEFWLFVNKGKEWISRLGFLVLFPVAVLVSLRTRRDVLLGVGLLVVVELILLGVFVIFGEFGVEIAAKQRASREAYLTIGYATINNNRTQVAIIFAALAAAAFGIGEGQTGAAKKWLFRLVAACWFALMVNAASTGSAAAAALGMIMVLLVGGIGTGRIWPMLRWLAVGAASAALIATILLTTENPLSVRIEEKLEAGVDRWAHWSSALSQSLTNPIGRGWTTETVDEMHTHNDFLNYFISYGWLTGAAYGLGAVLLLVALIKAGLHKPTGPTRPLVLAGIGAMSVYVSNSLTDMLSANIGYYQSVWAVALCAAGALLLPDEGDADSQEYGFMPVDERAFR